MTNFVDPLLADDPVGWINELPAYQRAPLLQLIQSGISYEEAAQRWITASASDTFHLGAASSVGNRTAFLAKLRAEVRAYLCGDKRYKEEREGLFGRKGITRTYVVSTLAVAISPHVGIAGPVLAPAIALILASLGKITLNAWCNEGPSTTSSSEDQSR